MLKTARLIVVGSTLLCAGCSGLADLDSALPPPDPLVAVRLDGQPIEGNPLHMQALDVDRMICVGEAQKAGLSGSTVYGRGIAPLIVDEIIRDDKVGDVMNGCMAQRGYVLVRASRAEAQMAQFRENAKMAAAGNVGHPIVTGTIPQSAPRSR